VTISDKSSSIYQRFTAKASSEATHAAMSRVYYPLFGFSHPESYIGFNLKGGMGYGE